MTDFAALWLEREGANVQASVRSLPLADLPQGDVVVQVAYSSLNYKDALAVTNTAPVVRHFPMVPGIDLSGVVMQSSDAAVQVGDRVMVTGWGLGEQHWGGLAQAARVPSAWVLPLPQGLDLRQVMQVGTAGLTAMLCIMALERQGLSPQSAQPIVVTGATGGVGSFAIALLAQLGYSVVASTGRSAWREYLLSLGASEVIGRLEMSDRALESERWLGAIDPVGGATLAALLRQTAYGGSVAACGLAGGHQIPTTVYPFILRGIHLLGIDSVHCPTPLRQTAWQRIAELLSRDRLNTIAHHTIQLTEVVEHCQHLLQGQSYGRTIVAIDAALR